MKSKTAIGALTLAIVASPAFAARPVNTGGGNGGGNGGGGGSGGTIATTPGCAVTNIAPTALACTGFFSGNLLSGSSGNITAQTTGLAPLGLAWDGQFANVTKINSLSGATTANFSTADQNPIAKVYGDTWIGVHFGTGAGLGGNVTAFYKLNGGLAGLQTVLLNIANGSSGFVVYKTGTAPPPPPPSPIGGTVPEPASWAMMIAGFGLVGAAMRRRKAAIA